jgi:hypothetical protein
MAVWYDTMVEWSSAGDPIYIGKAPSPGMNSGDPGWHLKKFTWSDGDIVLLEKRVGSWDNRANLGWRT